MRPSQRAHDVLWRWLLLGLLALTGTARAADSVAAPAAFKLVTLAPGVYAAIDQGGRAGANAGVVIGSESIALIDSFYKPEATQALVQALREISPLPIRYVINTHHHIDHVGGNAVLAAQGAVVIAHRHVADWLQPENLRLLGGDKASTAARERVAGLHGPSILVDDGLQVELGGRRLQLRHRLGHTGGDLTVEVVDAGVLFAGDLFWNRSIPNLIDARVADWLQTLDAMAAMAPSAAPQRYVPGHGEVGDLQDLRGFAGYLRTLSKLAADAQGRSSDTAARSRQLLDGLTDSYRDWAYFSGLAAANVRDMLAEQAGSKRVPQPPPAPPRSTR